VSNDKRAADDAEREAIFRRIHNERGWMDLQDIFNAGWDEALSSRADGGKDSSDALFNACMTREIDPTGTPKEVIDRIIDWEISLERADGGKDSSDAEPVAYLSTEPRNWGGSRIKPQGTFTIPVYTRPQPRYLNDEEIEEISHQRETWSVVEFGRALIDAAIAKEKK
jgi:hypothetical protein